MAQNPGFEGELLADVECAMLRFAALQSDDMACVVMRVVGGKEELRCE